MGRFGEQVGCDEGVQQSKGTVAGECPMSTPRDRQYVQSHLEIAYGMAGAILGRSEEFVDPVVGGVALGGGEIGEPPADRLPRTRHRVA